MPILLFPLRGVPEDEAEEVRALLDEHLIDYYETNAGNWGVSTPGLWLRDDAKFMEAKALLAIYQQQRYQSAQAHYQELRQQGQHATFWRSFKERPLVYLSYFFVMGLVIYASIKLLFEIGL